MARQATTEENPGHEVFCDVCVLDGRNIQAFSVCTECIEFLCDDCLDIHSNNKVLKNHGVMKKDELDGSITPEILHKLKEIVNCSEHGVKLEYICQEHSKLVCHNCIKRSHRMCKGVVKPEPTVESTVEYLQEVIQRVNEERKRADQTLHDRKQETKSAVAIKLSVQKELESYMEKLMKGVAQSVSSSEKKTSSCLNSLYELSNELQDSQELLQAVIQLNDMEKAKIVCNHVKISIQRSENVLDTVEIDKNCNARTQELIQKLNTCLIDLKLSFTELADAQVQSEDNRTDSFMSHGLLQQENLDSGSDSAVQFDNSNPAGRTDDSVPGNRFASVADTSPLTVQNESRDKATQTCRIDSRKSRVPLSQRSLHFSSVNNVCTDGETSCDISGIVVLTDRRIVITEFSYCRIKVFDEWFNFKIYLDTQSCPLSICRVQGQDHTVAVSYKSRRINIYLILSQSIMYLRGFDTDLHCRGICTISDNTIAVLLSNVPVYKKSGVVNNIDSNLHVIEVQIRSTNDGRKLDKINRFSKNVRGPIFIIQDLGGRLVLAEEDRLTAWNRYGSCIWSYKGNRVNDLAGLQGQDIDPEGNIYVCGQGSSNIHQVSSLEVACDRVIIPQVPSPRSIAFDPYNERLIIGCDSSKGLYVYNFV